jgi:hypothetical protein
MIKCKHPNFVYIAYTPQISPMTLVLLSPPTKL